MVGLVIVSHSATLAAGVVELARQMGGEEVAVEAAGGMAEPEGAIGTDVELVSAAIERAAGRDGVLVLMDLGSAVMSAEMAAEMLDGDVATRVVLSDAPLVEGAVAAAARAAAGAPLDEVAAEARAALGMKAAQLAPADAPAAPQEAGPAPDDADGHATRLEVTIPLGLHARPAARVVEAVARFDAQVSVTDETTGRGPADARSLSALVMLGVRQGHSLLVRAGGPGAQDALAALEALAAEGFGDEPGAVPAAAPPAPSPAEPAEPAVPAEPPPPGTFVQGIPVSPGIAIGPARRAGGRVAPPVDDLPEGDPPAERARLDAARAAAATDVRAARDRVATNAGEAEAAIFDAHLLLLDDAALLQQAHDAIGAGRSAAAAWSDAVGATASGLRNLGDPYLRERAVDVDDVGGRVLAHLAGMPPPSMVAGRGILVAADLTPGQAAELDRELVEAIALAHGGATSHAAILARALGIPAVAGLGDGVLALADGTTVALDGTAGTLEIDPGEAALAAREERRREFAARRERARARAHEPARTRDGETIEVAANIGGPSEVADALTLGADGVGLLRTEFLFLDRDEAPTESEQQAVLTEIAQALDGRPLIVRTLDAGADKPLRYLDQPPEDNPFLGVRGIRLGLARPELLRTQLRAILRTAIRFPLRVMLPMVATPAEYRAARALIDEVRADVGAPPVEVGVMVEVPALALVAGQFAPEVDFFSIGTNDLTQYTMAAERGNDAVAPLLGGVQPAVLRLVAAVTEAAEAHGRWTGVCGELAGDPGVAVLLAGLGVRELSMAPPLVPEVKQALRDTSLTDARTLARRALHVDDAAAVAALIASAGA